MRELKISEEVEDHLVQQVFDLFSEIRHRNDWLVWIDLVQEQFDLTKKMVDIDPKITIGVQKLAMEELAMDCGKEELSDRWAILNSQLDMVLRSIEEQGGSEGVAVPE